MTTIFSRMAYAAVLIALTTGAASAQVLTRIGYGKVRFGEKLAASEARLHQQATALKGEAACRYVKFKQYPGILFMVEQDVVTRAESRRWIRNAAGIKAGDTIATIRRQHPDIEVTPHKYERNGNYLRYATSDGNKAIVMEARKGKVTKIRAGVKPAVDYVEGCL